MCSLMKKWKGTFDSNIYENIILVINVLFFFPLREISLVVYGFLFLLNIRI